MCTFIITLFRRLLLIFLNENKLIEIQVTQNSVSPVPKKDWALVFWGFDWGLVGTWGLGLGLGLDNKALLLFY